MISQAAAESPRLLPPQPAARSFRCAHNKGSQMNWQLGVILGLAVVLVVLVVIRMRSKPGSGGGA